MSTRTFSVDFSGTAAMSARITVEVDIPDGLTDENQIDYLVSRAALREVDTQNIDWTYEGMLDAVDVEDWEEV